MSKEESAGDPQQAVVTVFQATDGYDPNMPESVRTVCEGLIGRRTWCEIGLAIGNAVEQLSMEWHICIYGDELIIFAGESITTDGHLERANRWRALRVER